MVAFLLACAGEDGAAPELVWPDWSAPATVIGALDTPAEEVFGRIADVAVGPEQNIHVLDDQASEVRVFTPGGAHVASFGGPGEGPRELQRPVSLTVDGTGRSLVGLADRRVKAFSISEPDAPPAMVELSVLGRTLCVVGERIVAQGSTPEDTTVVWVHDLQGNLQASYGAGPPAPNAMIGYAMRQGRAACVPPDLTVYKVGNDSTLTAYTLDGQRLWSAVIPAWLGTIVEATENGYSVRAPEDGFTVLESLVPLSARALLAQVSFRTTASREAGERWEELRSYLIDPRDGSVQPLAEALPHLVGASLDWLIGLEVDPFPRLLVWERPR
ncbi:MAG: hypothetical protein WEB88_03020 [Gemmatimonadota bacterium]